MVNIILIIDLGRQYCSQQKFFYLLSVARRLPEADLYVDETDCTK